MERAPLKFIFFIGKGGSGKDTQANLLLDRFQDSVKISTGDVYRGAKDSIGEYAKYHSVLESCITNVNSGGYIPDEPIVNIVKEIILEKTKSGINTFLFTGFPRTVKQLNLVDEMFSDMSQDFEIFQNYIYYPVSDEATRKRSEMRNEIARASGLSLREDDRPVSVEKKLKAFYELTNPLVEKLAAEGRLITIEAERTVLEIEAETSIRLSKERV